MKKRCPLFGFECRYGDRCHHKFPYKIPKLKDIKYPDIPNFLEKGTCCGYSCGHGGLKLRCSSYNLSMKDNIKYECSLSVKVGSTIIEIEPDKICTINKCIDIIGWDNIRTMLVKEKYPDIENVYHNFLNTLVQYTKEKTSDNHFLRFIYVLDKH